MNEATPAPKPGDGTEASMAQDERYDIVIIGGGPNGMTTAAYLAKCGLSVCVLEERTECGGACALQRWPVGVRKQVELMVWTFEPPE